MAQNGIFLGYIDLKYIIHYSPHLDSNTFPLVQKKKKSLQHFYTTSLDLVPYGTLPTDTKCCYGLNVCKAPTPNPYLEILITI